MTITIKTTDGTTLGTSAEITSIDRLTVNKTTNSNAYVIGENTATGDSVTLNFPIDSTKTFLGLIISPISSIDYGYPVGSTVDVSYTDDISLWTLYDSSAPEPDPEPEPETIDVLIKNASGTTLASSQGISAISTINLISRDTSKTLTMTDVNGEIITLSWSSAETDKTFMGLGWSPIETSTPTYPTNAGEIDANWTTNINLYEVWLTNATPEPEPEPDPNTFSMYLYNNKAEPNRLDKTDYLELHSTITGTLREECDLINPVITLELNFVPQFNYVYIPSFHRYYFVTGIRNIRNKMWQISLHCDVLMTYKTEILACGGVVDRTGDAYSPYVRDEEIPVDEKVNFEEVSLGEIVCDGYESAPLFSDGLVTNDDEVFILQVYRT